VGQLPWRGGGNRVLKHFFRIASTLDKETHLRRTVACPAVHAAGRTVLVANTTVLRVRGTVLASYLEVVPSSEYLEVRGTTVLRGTVHERVSVTVLVYCTVLRAVTFPAYRSTSTSNCSEYSGGRHSLRFSLRVGDRKGVGPLEWLQLAVKEDAHLELLAQHCVLLRRGELTLTQCE